MTTLSQTDALSVLLVDDHELIRQGLARAFERAADFTVVGEAGSVGEGLSLARRHQPDVVVTDVRLPGRHRSRPGPRAARRATEVGLVVLTMYAGDEQLFGALEAGASAFVAKDAPSDDVVAAARHASVSPRSFTAPTWPRPCAAADAHRARSCPAASPGAPPAGRGPRRRRDRRASSSSRESTAKTHISKIYEKLGAANRAQAIMLAIRAGLLSDARD